MVKHRTVNRGDSGLIPPHIACLSEETLKASGPFYLPSKQGTISEPVGTYVILVHNWYRSTSTCFRVYSHEYTCSACCHEF